MKLHHIVFITTLVSWMSHITQALAQSAPFKIKQGILTVAPISPLLALPEFAKKYNLEIEFVTFQRFADARTALATGDIDATPFGPHDISLALAQGNKSLVGVMGIADGGDCVVVRKGEDIKDWKALTGKTVGVGAGSISWLKFAASTQEAGVPYNSMKIVNIVGGGANYTRALQAKEIDMAVVWQPFCAQAVVQGFGMYPSVDHNKSRMVGGMVAVMGVNRSFMEKNRDVTQRLVNAYVDTLNHFKVNRSRWGQLFAQQSGLSTDVAIEAIQYTTLDETMPLEAIKRVTKYLANNGILAKDVSNELESSFNYEFLSKATGKTPAQLGLNK
jgi:ABC-type nitrate/sulfonate/bicarbonate transport system substrate-binding protein